MISRRTFAALLAGLPLIGRASADDGVALKSIAHPEGVGVVDAVGELNEAALESAMVELRIYAHAGETVTCENGHPICDFVEDVAIGQTQDVPRQLGNWRQDVPQVGALPLPVCAQCGAQFTDGSAYHFADGWRHSYRKHSFSYREWRALYESNGAGA
jgi:hypothetical protein